MISLRNKNTELLKELQQLQANNESLKRELKQRSRRSTISRPASRVFSNDAFSSKDDLFVKQSALWRRAVERFDESQYMTPDLNKIKEIINGHSPRILISMNLRVSKSEFVLYFFDLQQTDPALAYCYKIIKYNTIDGGKLFDWAVENKIPINT